MRRLALVVLVGIGCGKAPPSETLRVVAAERAPILPEPEDDEQSVGGLHRGELITVGKPVRTIAWHGPVDDQPLERSGEMVQVRRADGESWFFAFTSDLGGEARAPTAAWLCERLKRGGGECAARLRRIQLGDTLVAYDPCGVGTCAAAAVRGSKVAPLALDWLSSMRPATIEGEQVLLAETRWVKGPTWTGARLYVLRVAGGQLARALAIDTEEIDARNAPAIQRLGHVTVENGALVYRGNRREVLPADGKVLVDQPLVETYHLAKK